MTFEEALELARLGVRVCRPGWSGDFMLVREGRPVMGRFIGEASLAAVRFWVPPEVDAMACDWMRFSRDLPDEWEGCDAPQRGPGRLA